MSQGATTLADITSADWSVMLDSTAELRGIVNSPAAALVTSPGETAAMFDGSTGYVADDTEWFNNPQVFSIECWFKTTVAPGFLVAYADSPAGINNDRVLFLDSSGKLNFGVWPTYYVQIESEASYADGTWHHVVGTLGPGGMALYVDGALVASDSNTAAQDFQGRWYLALTMPEWSVSGYLNGTLARFAYYTSALSAGRVAAHFAANHDAAYDAAVGADSPTVYLKLDEVNGPVAADSSGNGNPGLYNAGVTLGAAGPLTALVLPPTPAGGAGLGNVVQGIDDVDQCIRIILTTPLGSDPLRPTFGCDLASIIDLPINAAIPLIISIVTDAITQWEPRASIVSISVAAVLTGAQAGAQMRVSIVWQLTLAAAAEIGGTGGTKTAGDGGINSVRATTVLLPGAV